MDDHDRIERLEAAVAALAGLLSTTNLHIEHELMEIASILTGDGSQERPEPPVNP